MLERAERNLGQTFLGFATQPTTADLSLEPEVMQKLRSVNPASVSKVRVDENGELLVVYHGTNTQFTEFAIRWPLIGVDSKTFLCEDLSGSLNVWCLVA